MAVDHGDILLKYLKLGEDGASEEAGLLRTLFFDLGVRPDDDILDLCCGYGRHAVRLAEKGYSVTGVDISPTLIKHGRDLAKSMGLEDRVHFVVGDVRNLKKLLEHKRESYGAVISMWASLGYYDDDADRSILRQSHALASGDGILVLEMGNRDFITKHFLPHDFYEFEDIELHEYTELDLQKSRLRSRWRFYRKEGENLIHVVSIPLDMRIYSLHELVELVESAGWRFTNSFGNLYMQPVSSEMNRIVITGAKSDT